MGAENVLVEFNALLVTGTAALYGAYHALPQQLSISIAWYAVIPVALLYSYMLAGFSTDGSIQLPEKNAGGAPCLLRRAVRALKPAFVRSHVESLSTIRSCTIALICTFTTQFIALAYFTQAYEYLCAILPEVSHLFFLQVLVAMIAWACYGISVCVLELEVVELYRQKALIDAV